MSKELNHLLTLFKQKKYLIAEKKCSELIKKIKPNYEIFNIYAVILYEIKIRLTSTKIMIKFK